MEDLRKVVDRHASSLMAIDGVIGVYAGAVDLDEDPLRPCLRVVVLEGRSDLRTRIPAAIEGYPVILEESDPIRPFGN